MIELRYLSAKERAVYFDSHQSIGRLFVELGLSLMDPRTTEDEIEARIRALNLDIRIGEDPERQRADNVSG